MERKVRKTRLHMTGPNAKAKAVSVCKDHTTSKVKVQYIENERYINRKEHLYSMEDVENVEYLDEAISEEYIQSVTTAAIDEDGESTHVHEEHKYEDAFYPNAIHCLIALYRTKYQQMDDKSTEEIKAMHVWEHITKEMNESYFDFSLAQVKEKFRELRSQYFGVNTQEDIEAFHYFDQMHEIYQDKGIDAIAAGDGSLAQSNVYCDEVLQGEQVAEGVHQVSALSDEENAATYEVEEDADREEIAHKETEFIDMVEKELQAMEKDTTVTELETDMATNQIHQSQVNSKDILLHQQHDADKHHEGPHQSLPVQTVFIKCEDTPDDAMRLPSVKRIKLHVPSDVVHPAGPKIPLTLHGQLQKRCSPIVPVKVNGIHSQKPLGSSYVPPPDANTAPVSAISECKDMTLAEFNAEQERRHQEKVLLMRETLTLQQHLIDQLLNRL